MLFFCIFLSHFPLFFHLLLIISLGIFYLIFCYLCSPPLISLNLCPFLLSSSFYSFSFFPNQILTLFFMTSLLYLLTFSLCLICFFHLLIHNSIIYLCMCFSFIFFGCYCCRNDFARYLGNVS